MWLKMIQNQVEILKFPFSSFGQSAFKSFHISFFKYLIMSHSLFPCKHPVFLITQYLVYNNHTMNWLSYLSISSLLTKLCFSANVSLALKPYFNYVKICDDFLVRMILYPRSPSMHTRPSIFLTDVSWFG